MKTTITLTDADFQAADALPPYKFDAKDSSDIYDESLAASLNDVQQQQTETPTQKTQSTQKTKRTRAKSRPQRWQAAVASARDAFDELSAAVDELRDLKDEYQEWLDNLPENMQGGATADLLQTICDLDFESTLDDVSNTIDEAENAELPRGFGRD